MPETSHGVDILLAQKLFDGVVLGECILLKDRIVLVPVESILAIPRLVSLILNREVPESTLKLMLAPVHMEIRHILRFALYRSVPPPSLKLRGTRLGQVSVSTHLLASAIL